jgi:hypothetical protein
MKIIPTLGLPVARPYLACDTGTIHPAWLCRNSITRRPPLLPSENDNPHSKITRWGTRAKHDPSPSSFHWFPTLPRVDCGSSLKHRGPKLGAGLTSLTTLKPRRQEPHGSTRLGNPSLGAVNNLSRPCGTKHTARPQSLNCTLPTISHRVHPYRRALAPEIDLAIAATLACWLTLKLTDLQLTRHGYIDTTARGRKQDLMGRPTSISNRSGPIMVSSPPVLFSMRSPKGV